MTQLFDVNTAITTAVERGVENAMAQAVADAGLPPAAWMLDFNTTPGRFELIGELDLCLTPAEVREAVTAYADTFGTPVMASAGHLVTTAEFKAGPYVVAVTVTGLVDEDAADHSWRRAGVTDRTGGRT